jgi:hypothetical protein
LRGLELGWNAVLWERMVLIVAATLNAADEQARGHAAVKGG